MRQSAGKYLVWALVALAAVAALFLADLGNMPLTDRDEGEYAAAAASMRRTGDYIVPTLNGRPYLEKPGLVFWAVAGAQSLLWDDETGARLPSAVSAVLLTLLVGIMVWRVAGNPAWGLLAAAACAFTPLMALLGRACLTDALLTLFTTSSLAFFFAATERAAPRDRPWYLAAWVFLALGFLTKGPVALAVVLPPAVVYALVQRRLIAILGRAGILWGILIFLAFNLPWYGLAYYRMGDDFLHSFFLSQNLRRFSEVLLGHGGGYLYYLPVLFLGAFPFFPAALAGLGSALFKNPRARRQAEAGARLLMLAAVSFLWVFLIFSAAATKQINYILPALPFAAVLAGYFLWRLGQFGLWPVKRREEPEPSGKPAAGPNRPARTVFWWGLYILGGLWSLILAGLPPAMVFFWDRILASIRPDSSEYALPEKAPWLILWPLLGASAAAGLVILCRWAERRGRPWLANLWLVAGAAVFCAFLVFGLLPQAAGIIQEPARRMALEAAGRAEPRTAMITYGLWKPSLFYYLGRDVERIRVEEKERLAKALAADEPVLVFSRIILKEKLAQTPSFFELAAYGGYLLGGNLKGRELWLSRGNKPPSKPGALP